MGSANGVDPRLQIRTSYRCARADVGYSGCYSHHMAPTNRTPTTALVMQSLRDFMCLLDAIYNDLATECNNICVTLRYRGLAAAPGPGAQRDFQAQCPSGIRKKPAPDFAAGVRRYAGWPSSTSELNPMPKPGRQGRRRRASLRPPDQRCRRQRGLGPAGLRATHHETNSFQDVGEGSA